ncbi:rCG46714 [Rattus norvegicus]|uniref:RCG46714 n=1 Tax=Rattus norvegicus TaxID=10116 RepID=A6IX50_RAT|nr:rCG46714 [Rattus norvegicus]
MSLFFRKWIPGRLKSNTRGHRCRTGCM